MKVNTTDTDVIAKSILDVLSESGDLNLLPKITEELEKEFASETAPQEVVVTSAVAIGDDQKPHLESAVKRFMKEKLPFSYTVNKSLLGGFTIAIGDWFLDASLKSELNKLKTELKY